MSSELQLRATHSLPPCTLHITLLHAVCKYVAMLHTQIRYLWNNYLPG